MSFPSYSLEVISHHSNFNNKTFRKHHLQGIDTIGVFGDEPFEIRFVNHTLNKIQVVLSLDGTNILNGEPATTENTKGMWVVNGYGSLSVKAWVESDKGGASFVFTHAGNSVAAHTHGDTSCRGIIAAAVFVEGEPVKITPQNHYHYGCGYGCGCHSSWIMPYYDGIRLGGITTTSGGANLFRSGNYYVGVGGGGSITSNSYTGSNTMLTNNFNQQPIGNAYTTKALSEVSESASPIKEMQTLASVGAGQYTEQNISYVAGLIKPLFQETLRVKYVWYDSLVELIKEQQAAEAQPSGFPGDKEKKHIDLGSTPRVGQHNPLFRRVDDTLLERFC